MLVIYVAVLVKSLNYPFSSEGALKIRSYIASKGLKCLILDYPY